MIFSYHRNDEDVLTVQQLLIRIILFCTCFLERHRDCHDLYKKGVNISGVYQIDPDDKGSFDVFCDMTTAGGGWTVFQHRLDGSVDFYRNWQFYKHGFGDLNGEFWLGLDKINRITSALHNELRVDMEDFEGNSTYAEYDSFFVANENHYYKLSLGQFSGKSVVSYSLCLYEKQTLAPYHKVI